MRKNWRILAILLVVSVICVLVIGCSSSTDVDNTSTGDSVAEDMADNPLVGDSSEEYYMITFMAELEFWQDCFRGFEDAGDQYGVTTVYTGSSEWDINEQVTILEQVVAKQPAGIAITCVNDEALAEPINKALEAGIRVITFDNPSATSDAGGTILQSDSYAGGQTAGKEMAEAIGGEGTVAVLYVAGTTNHENRSGGFKDYLAENYPDITVVDGLITGDQDDAATVTASILQANPDLKGVFTACSPAAIGASIAAGEVDKNDQVFIIGYDTDTSLLDAIKSGEVDATMAQGSYNEGYWVMHFLYHSVHELMNPVQNWQENGINPLPSFVDTGVTFVTAENVDSFYMAE